MKDTLAVAARNDVVAAAVADAFLRERVRLLVAEFYRINPEREDPALDKAP